MMILAAWLAAAGVAMAPMPATPDKMVGDLIDRFEAARATFDAPALANTLAPDYEEISPVGDVDSRAQVLSYYLATAKRPVPPMASDQITLRTNGPVALFTARRTITLPDGTTRALRLRYVARRDRSVWRLVSAQYTPIRAPKAP